MARARESLPEKVDVAHLIRAGVLAGASPRASLPTMVISVFGDEGHVGFAVYRTVKAHRKDVRLALGDDAQLALASLQTLLHRQIAKHSLSAVQSTTTAALKPGLSVADMGAASGPLIGALSSAADLVQLLVWLILEINEARAGNKILAGSAEDIDASVFEVCPLLGCCILTCSTRSNILNWLVEDMGSDNWMQSVEQMNKRITPILSLASQRIVDARYELPPPPGMAVSPGDVIRADEGDLLIKLERLKQRAVGTAKRSILHPKGTWKQWKANRRVKKKIKDQSQAWDD